MSKKNRVLIVVPIIDPHDAISRAALNKCQIINKLAGLSCSILTMDARVKNDLISTFSGLLDLLVHSEFLNADVIIYEYGLYNEIFQAILLGNGRAKQVVSFHNVTPAEFVPPSARGSIKKSLMQIHLFSNVDDIWCASQTNLDMLDNEHVPYACARVLPIAVEDPPRLYLAEKKSSTPTLLFMGRFVQSKGILDLLKALQTVQERGKVAFRVNLAGNQSYSDPKYLAAVKEAAAKLGDSVKFVGEVSNSRKHELFHEADILAIPSYHEGFCVPIVEALRSGCIPVGYSAYNLPKITNGFGRLVPPADVSALATCIEELCLTVSRSSKGKSVNVDRGLLSIEEFDTQVTQYLENFTTSHTTGLIQTSLTELAR